VAGEGRGVGHGWKRTGSAGGAIGGERDRKGMVAEGRRRGDAVGGEGCAGGVAAQQW
jgi:hypothetical protein